MNGALYYITWEWKCDLREMLNVKSETANGRREKLTPLSPSLDY